MSTTPYVDPQSVHNPATGNSPPASWGDTVRDDLEFLIAPPSCKMLRTTAQTLTTATVTAIAFNAADAWDTDSFHDTVTNNTRMTVPTGLGGKYLVQATLLYAGSATGDRYASIWVNGADQNIFSLGPTAAAGLGPGFHTGGILSLAVGDYVEVKGYQSSGGNLDVVYATCAMVYVSR